MAEIFYSKILTGLVYVLSSAVTVPVKIGGEGSTGVYIMPVGAEQIGAEAAGTTYRYSVTIDYRERPVGDWQRVLRRSADIQDALNSNLNYTTASGTYSWHDGQVISVEYIQEDNAIAVRISWECTHNEVTG